MKSLQFRGSIPKMRDVVGQAVDACYDDYPACFFEYLCDGKLNLSGTGIFGNWLEFITFMPKHLSFPVSTRMQELDSRRKFV